MAYIHREAAIQARPQDVWAAVRDVGAIHTRLAPGFVVDTRLAGDVREVRFGDGGAVRERIVAIDDGAQRLSYAVIDGPMTHHNASIQVFPEGDHACRFVWITDLLPDDLARPVADRMTAGIETVKVSLETAALDRASRGA